MSYIKYQITSVGYQVSDKKYQISINGYQVPDIKYQISNINCQAGPGQLTFSRYGSKETAEVSRNQLSSNYPLSKKTH